MVPNMDAVETTPEGVGSATSSHPPVHASLSASAPKVLFLVDALASLADGGTERQLLQLAGIARKNGLEAQICVLRGTQWLTSEVARCPVKHFQLNRLQSVDGVKEVRKIVHWMRQERFDILQTFFREANLLGPWMGRLAGIPLVVGTRRNLNDGAERSDFGCRLRLLLQSTANLSVDRILVNSQAVHDRIMETERVPDRKLQVIYNGVDVALVRSQPGMRARMRAELGLQSHQIVIGNISRLCQVKGVDLFVQAAHLAYQSDAALRFLLIGGGPLQAEMQSLIQGEGLDSVITLTGPVDDVRPYLAAMDVAVLCSHTEGFSNSILEYMAAGLPVIATDVGGNREALGDAGVLIPRGDISQLAAAMIALRDPRVRSRYSALSHQQVQRFDVRIAEEQMGEFYRHCLRCRVARG